MLAFLRGTYTKQGGFALPTVMISSIIMFIVLLVGLQTITSVTASINNQYVDRILQTAAESGNRMLEECIETNGIDAIDTWWPNNAFTLKPGTSCGGSTAGAVPSAYVLETDNPRYQTSFEVTKPSVTNGVYSTTVTGIANQLRRNTTTSVNAQNVATQVKFNELKIKEMSVGSGYACAIMQNNKVYCWGSDYLGRLGSVPSLNSLRPTEVEPVWGNATVTALSNAGEATMCAIAGGDAYCWGDNSKRMLGSTEVPNTGEDSFSSRPVAVTKASGALSGKTVTKIAVGANTVCALASGVVYCWGSDIWGSMADGTTTTGSSTPKAIGAGQMPANDNIIDISLSFNVGCVIRSGGAAYCWGDNYYGAVGDNTIGKDTPAQREKNLPRTVLGSLVYTKIYASASRVCAVRSTVNTPLKCWGIEVGNGLNHMSDGSNPDEYPTPQDVARPSPMATSGYSYDSMAIGRGRSQACVLQKINNSTTQDSIWCWGANQYGQLGRSVGANSTFYNSPGRVEGLPSGAQIDQISAGDDTTCALISGDAYCWGRAYDGMKSDANGVKAPARITIKTDYVVAGQESTCAVDRAGTTSSVYCWGLNTSGQLGRSASNATWLQPGGNGATISNVKSSGGRLLMDIGLGGGCAINSSDMYYCWGNQSGTGKNGNGNFQAPNNINWTPTQVVGYGSVMSSIGNINYLDGGYRMNCAIMSGATRCAGGPASSNPYSLPGNGNTKVGLSTSTEDGNSVSTYKYTSGADPQAFSVHHVAGVGPLASGVTQIVSGGSSACVLKTDAQVYCWGSNTNGRIGQPQSVSGNITPSVVPGVASAKLIAGGDRTTCAATTNNRLYCWGYGLDGQLLADANGNYRSSYGAKLMNGSGVLYNKNIISVAVGESHICAVAEDGSSNRLYCWGKNNKGQLGNGTNTSVVSLDPSSIQETVLTDSNTGSRMNPLRVSSKGSTTCAQTNYPSPAPGTGYEHNLYCWGNNDYGQVGNFEKQNDFTSVPAPALLNAPLLNY